MKRTPTFVAVALAAATLLAACGDDTGSGGGSAGPAAVVDGVDITAQDVVDELAAIEANTAFLSAVEESAAAQGQPAIVADDGEFSTEFVRSTLGTRIQYAIVAAEVDRRELEVTDACRDEAREQTMGRYSSISATGDGADVLDAFDEVYVRYLVDRQADVLSLQAELNGQPCGEGAGDDAVQAYFDEHEAELAVETACVSHILVDTREEADEIAGLLDAGGDFGELAAERSTDPGSGAEGGELGCAPAGRYVAEFDAAAFAQPVGEVGDPVESEFGFHLILVTERSVPTLDDLREQIVTAIQSESEAAFGAWFEEALGRATVEVDPRYGTWDPTTAVIVPPAEAELVTPDAEG